MNTHILKFLNYLALQRRYSKLTVQSYQNDLLLFETYIKQHFNIAPNACNRQQIRAFIAHSMQQGLNASTVNRRLSVVKSFYRFLVLEGIVSSHPARTLSGPKKAKRLPVFISEEQLQGMFDAVSYPLGFSGIRDKTLMDTLYQTGMRRAEIIGLQHENVDMHGLQLKVMGKRSKERIIPFGMHLARQFELYITEKSKYGFHHPHFFLTNQGAPLYPVFVQRLVQRILTEVTTVHKKSPHVLRHSFATHMLNAGADINAVKELLGHQSLAATQIYTHNSISELKKIYAQAHPRSGQ